MEREEKQKQENFVASAVTALLVILLVGWFFPDTIPFGIFEFWEPREAWTDWVRASWPIFAWGIGATVLHSIFTRNDRRLNRHAEAILAGGFFISLLAGMLEEIGFRWLIFLANIVYSKVLNFLFFGFLGFGIPEWFYNAIAGPIANFFTLGFLTPALFHESGWAVGAALLAANAFFRDSHKYLGPMGWINSWFIGMFMFWLLFQYGLIACIVMHFLYDLFIFIVRYIDAAIERALGWV